MSRDAARKVLDVMARHSAEQDADLGELLYCAEHVAGVAADLTPREQCHGERAHGAGEQGSRRRWPKERHGGQRGNQRGGRSAQRMRPARLRSETIVTRLGQAEHADRQGGTGDRPGRHQRAHDLQRLGKRDAFRAAFAGFHPDAVASFGDADVERLLADSGIVRNRRRIEATIANARATVGLRATGEPLEALVRAHAPLPRGRPLTTWADVPATAPETVALAHDLKRRGFRFVGPTTLYALMQACGLVDDHLAGCPARRAVEGARRAAGLAHAGSER